MQQATALIDPAGLLESWDRRAWWSPPGSPRRLEALIATANGDGSLTVHHYFAGQQRPDNPWLRGDAISHTALGPGALSQRGWAGTRSHELVAHIPEPDGLVEYAWRVNDAATMRWRRIGLVDAAPEPHRPDWDGPQGAPEWGSGRVVAVATAQTRLRTGWVQAIVQVDGSLYHLHRQQRAGKVRWLRHACIRLADPEPFAVAESSSVKLAQVSGEVDSQPNPDGPPRRTLSTSFSRSGVRGTDLGVRVEHAGRSYLLFGDTHWQRRWLGTRDAIAEVIDPAADRPRFSFHGSPLAIAGGLTTTREYDVPLDAFDVGGELYAFFTSNHFADAQVMGRSVLTAAPELTIDPAQRRRPLRFDHLGTFSSHRFINVSVQQRGDLLYLWGSGAYRADDLRLARVDLTTRGLAEGLRDGSADAFLAAVQYWTGSTADDATWSDREADAVPLLAPGAHGEVSVRWVPELDRYLMLTMSGPEDPIGPSVVLRTAPQPWGPWSQRVRLLDWIAAGMFAGDPVQRFIRFSADGTDPVGDNIFRGQANATGAAYAPYFYDARLDGEALVLRYTLSTWNPYQVVLMRHRLEPSDLPRDKTGDGS